MLIESSETPSRLIPPRDILNAMGLLETAEELLLFCYHGNAALLRQDVVAASSGFISVEVRGHQLASTTWLTVKIVEHRANFSP